MDQVKTCLIRKTPKIYTKKGDKGMTSLYDGTRVSKNYYTVHTLGKLDEFNVRIGAIKILVRRDSKIFKDLEEIQHNTMLISSIIATPNEKKKVVGIEEGAEKKLEEAIDHYHDILPPLKNFVLPGGNALSVRSHSARVQARECERYIAGLETRRNIDTAKKYFNRLSDYLFTLSRWFAKEDVLHK